MHDILGTKTICSDMERKLKQESFHKKQIAGVPNYDITKNPRYADAFQFTQVELRDTQEEKDHTNFILMCLNLAYHDCMQENKQANSKNEEKDNMI